VPESLRRSGEAPKYQVHRINQTESTHRIKYIGASPLRVLATTNPTFHVGLPKLNPFRITTPMHEDKTALSAYS
jgi:hypothetical protein